MLVSEIADKTVVFNENLTLYVYRDKTARFEYTFAGRLDLSVSYASERDAMDARAYRRIEWEKP